jgi:hypothetical protein
MSMSSSLFIIGVLAGTLLGLRYKVLVLVPAIFLACGLTVFATVIGNRIFGGFATFATIGLPSLVVTVAVQVGYMCGIGLQYIFLSPRRFGLRRMASLPESLRSLRRH